MNFMHYIPTRILFGPGELNKLHQQKLPGKKALIVISAGKSMKANGYLARVEGQLEQAGVSHALFDGIQPNPTLRNVMAGAEAAKENGCDFVLGLGGGSSIDAAKAIAVMAANPGDYWDYNGGITGKGLPVPNDPLPIVAITTTAGTGTEANPWTVILNEATSEKLGFGYEKTYPALSIVDPELMLSVPPLFTAFQGFDILFHTTESVINKKEHPMGEMFALKSIEYVANYLPAAVKDGSSLEARSYVALANTLAGFYTMCTSEHAIEHALSGYHPNIPHGAGLIMISRAYFQYFIDQHACDGLFLKMARAMGVEKASRAQDFADALARLQSACGVDNLRMSDYGVNPEEFPVLAADARRAAGGLFVNDPCPLPDGEVRKIFAASYR